MKAESTIFLHKSSNPNIFLISTVNYTILGPINQATRRTASVFVRITIYLYIDVFCFYELLVLYYSCFLQTTFCIASQSLP